MTISSLLHGEGRVYSTKKKSPAAMRQGILIVSVAVADYLVSD